VEPVPNTSSFLITLQNRQKGLDLPGFTWPLLPVHEPLLEGSPGPCNVVSWSGLDILTEFPGSSASTVPNSAEWEDISTSSLPTCEAGCTEYSTTVNDAARLLKYTHDVSSRFITPGDAENPQEDVDWNEAVGAGSDLYSFSSPI
jgi:hypothetical protein